jgi:hypothetical protein
MGVLRVSHPVGVEGDAFMLGPAVGRLKTFSCLGING